MDKTIHEKFDLNEVVFRYKWWIGGVLLVAVIASGIYLIQRENSLVIEVDNGGYDAKITELEAKIADQQIKVDELSSKISSSSTANQAVSTAVEGGNVAGASTATAAKSTAPAGAVNLNTATAAELDTLPGIGTAYAQRILDYRQAHGGFKSIDELKNIKGIGDKTFDKLKDLVAL